MIFTLNISGRYEKQINSNNNIPTAITSLSIRPWKEQKKQV